MIMMTVTILLVAFVVTAVHACHPRTVGEIFWSVSGMWNVGAEKIYAIYKECAE